MKSYLPSRLLTLVFFMLSWPLIAAPPVNDAFPNRIPITGTFPQTVTGTNVEATKESGEPNHAGYAGGKSVWWTWTATTTGNHVIKTVGSNFDTLLAVYTGTAVNALTLRASDDQSGGNNTSLLTLNATSGTAYQIAVDGWNAQSGSILLTIEPPPPPPANDAFANRLDVTGLSLIAGTTVGASKEPGEPNHGGYTGGGSVWYTWTAPATGECTIQITNNAFTPVLGVYSGTTVNALSQVAGAYGNTLSFRVVAATTYQIAVDRYSTAGSFTLNFGNIIPPPLNDSFASRVMLPAGQASTSGSNVGATKEAGEPNHAGNTGGRSVWWSWIAPSSGEVTVEVAGGMFYSLIGVYTGTSVGSLESAGTTSAGSPVSFIASAGVTYHIAVDAYNGSSGSTFNLNIGIPIPPSANDSFANRVMLSGSLAKATGHNRAATKEAGEPLHAGNSGGKSVWYSWTAPSTGTYNAYLSGKDLFAYYGLLAVYTGSSVNALVSVGSSSGGTPRLVTFAANAGTVYQIAVDGASYTPGVTYSGEFTVSVSQPPVNDAFAASTNLGSVSAGTWAGWVDFSASMEIGEPDRPFQWWLPGPRTIWWHWTAPSTGFFTFDLLASDFDTVLDIYTGTSVSFLTPVASNHDVNDSGRSRLDLYATSGTTYRIRVRGETPDDVGNVSLQISPLTAPASADDHVRWGRAYLQRQITSSLADADAQFDSALALNSSHPDANFFKAITRAARLEQTTAFQTALTGLGVVDGDLYTGGHTIPKDSNGNRIATPGTHTSHGLAFLVNTVLPELTAIRAHLDKVSASDFQTSISDTECTYQYTLIDAGDISLIKASSYLTEAMIRLLQTIDVGVSVADLITQSNQAVPTAKSLHDSFSTILGNTGNNQRSAFKAALQTAIFHYQAGSNFVRTLRANPADDRHLFHLPSYNVAAEAEVSARALEASSALDGPTMLAGETVDLSLAISSQMSVRDQLPGLFGNKAVAGTSPGTTFGGVAPGMNQTKIDNRLRKLGVLHEVNTFANWTQHFLGNLPSGSQTKTADPDGDMLSNFAEFAFNLDPQRPSSSAEFALGSLQTNIIDNKPYLNLSFRRRIVRDAISYVVAVSDDLTSWDRTGAQLVQVGAPVPNSDGLTETVTFRVLAGPDVTSRKFVKLEVQDLTP